MAAIKKSSATDTFVIEDCILSYPHLFQPQQVNGSGDPKYSTVLLVTEQAAQYIMQQAQQLAASHFTNGESQVQKFQWPVTPAAEKMSNAGAFPYRDNPRTASRYIVNAKANQEFPPQVVDGSRNPIMDRSQIYAGCVAAAGIRLYTYNNMGNIGIGVGLSAVMKTADGESLSDGGAPDPKNLFASVQVQGGQQAGMPSPNGMPAPQGQVVPQPNPAMANQAPFPQQGMPGQGGQTMPGFLGGN